MPQSLSKNLIHLIYSTKNRQACLTPVVRRKLFAYQAGIFESCESPALVIGGEMDHIHALFTLSKNHALCNIVEEVKKGSSKWLKTQGRAFAAFHWQNGYGAFSIGASQVKRVRRYIEEQAEHHRARSFQEEVRLFLRHYGVEYDERYVWD